MTKPTILIADDHTNHLRLLELNLASEAHDLVLVSNGIEVLEYLRQHTPELIILDVQMPHLTGLELCARIKGVSRLSRVPVILVTGLKDPTLSANAELVRAEAVLEKPLKMKELLEMVDRLLSIPLKRTHHEMPRTSGFQTSDRKKAVL